MTKINRPLGNDYMREMGEEKGSTIGPYTRLLTHKPPPFSVQKLPENSSETTDSVTGNRESIEDTGNQRKSRTGLTLEEGLTKSKRTRRVRSLGSRESSRGRSDVRVHEWVETSVQ